MVGHVTPEACDGGTLAIVHNGDPIRIDKVGQTLNLLISDAEIASRLEALEPPPSKATSGVLRKYTKLVSSAHEGCYCG